MRIPDLAQDLEISLVSCMHQDVHQNGGFGSAGYGYSWKLAESQKNLLRTHTTAVSSRMLYKLAQDGFRPAKYFSIDRVFRNEAIDRTHLAEFHQVEGEHLRCQGRHALCIPLGAQKGGLAGLPSSSCTHCFMCRPHLRPGVDAGRSHRRPQPVLLAPRIANTALQARVQPLHRAQHGDLQLQRAAQKVDGGAE